MRGVAAAAKVDDDLNGDLVVVTNHGEVGDPDARRTARVQERLERSARGEPWSPVHHADGSVATDGGAEVSGFAVHGWRVASAIWGLTSSRAARRAGTGWGPPPELDAAPG